MNPIVWRLITFFALGLATTSAYAADSFNPNAGRSDTYAESNPKDGKGDGVGVEFDVTEAGETKGKAFIANEGSVTGYPNANIREVKGDAEELDYDSGPIGYPSRNPPELDILTSPPPVADEDDESAESEPDEPDLPEGYCPLMHERRAFNDYGRYWRHRSYIGLRMNGNHGVVTTRVRNWRKPGRLGGGFRLLSTTYDPKSGRYVGRLLIPAGYACGDGVHQVHQDDYLADGVLVLDVQPGLILIMADDELAYLHTSDRSAPDWRMVWDAGIEVEYEKGRTTGEILDAAKNASKQSKRPKRRGKSKRKRRQGKTTKRR